MSEEIKEHSVNASQQELLAMTSMEMEPVAYIEHHKAGDNLNWEPTNHSYAKDTALYSAEQLATLQAKLEQTEKYKAELTEKLIAASANNYDYLQQLRASNEALKVESRLSLDTKLQLDEMIFKFDKCSNALVSAEARIAELKLFYEKPATKETPNWQKYFDKTPNKTNEPDWTGFD